MDIRPLPPDLQEIARRELNEDPARVEQDLKHIRDWLAKQPHLNARTDSQWLMAFLRASKFSLERTKTKLDMFYTMRSALPEFFKNRDPLDPEIQKLLDSGFLVPLPEPDDQGRMVVLGRHGGYDPHKVNVADLIKVNMIFSDYILCENDRSIVAGVVSVMDHKSMTMAHMTLFTPSLVKKMTTVFQDGYPNRQKGLHHLHMNSAFTTIFNLFKSFMNEKLRRRVFVHEDLESLYKVIPKRILPQEYGGDAGPIDNIIKEWKKKLESHRAWLLEDDKYGCDEKKRPGKPKTQEDLFGLEGSFRQLNVD